MRKLLFLCFLMPFFVDAQQVIIENKINTELTDNSGIRASTLRDNLKAVLKNTQIKSVDGPYAPLVKNFLDSSNVAETATGETYQGRAVYTRTFFGKFGNDFSVDIATGIYRVIDAVGWTSADFYFSSETQLNREVWGFCKFDRLTGVVRVTRDSTEPWIKNFRFQRTIKYTR